MDTEKRICDLKKQINENSKNNRAIYQKTHLLDTNLLDENRQLIDEIKAINTGKSNRCMKIVQ